MNRTTGELTALTAVSALSCGMAVSFDYLIVGAVFQALTCAIGLITLAFIHLH